MKCVRDQFLAGSRLPADQYRRVGVRHLDDLLVDLFHRTRSSDDIRKFVAFLEFTAKVCVLLEQTLSFVVEKVIGLYGLGHHGRDDAKATQVRVVVAVLLEWKINAQSADWPVVDKEGHADERDLPFVEILAPANTIQEHRLAAHLRHYNRLSGFDDPARDSLAQTVMRAVAGFAKTDRGFDADFTGVAVEHGHGAPQHLVMPFQDFENPLKRGSCRQSGA